MKDALCAICGGTLRSRKITIDRLVEKHLYLFEQLSARVCEQCGEIWIPEVEVERMERAIQGNLKPKKRIAVPVY